MELPEVSAKSGYSSSNAKPIQSPKFRNNVACIIDNFCITTFMMKMFVGSVVIGVASVAFWSLLHDIQFLAIIYWSVSLLLLIELLKKW